MFSRPYVQLNIPNSIYDCLNSLPMEYASIQFYKAYLLSYDYL